MAVMNEIQARFLCLLTPLCVMGVPMWIESKVLILTGRTGRIRHASILAVSCLYAPYHLACLLGSTAFSLRFARSGRKQVIQQRSIIAIRTIAGRMSTTPTGVCFFVLRDHFWLQLWLLRGLLAGQEAARHLYSHFRSRLALVQCSQARSLCYRLCWSTEVLCRSASMVGYTSLGPISKDPA